MREDLLKKVCSKFAKVAEKSVEDNPVSYSPFYFGYEIELEEKEEK
ncbi:hypothetical protein [Clostridium thermobutyricum]